MICSNNTSCSQSLLLQNGYQRKRSKSIVEKHLPVVPIINVQDTIDYRKSSKILHPFLPLFQMTFYTKFLYPKSIVLVLIVCLLLFSPVYGTNYFSNKQALDISKSATENVEFVFLWAAYLFQFIINILLKDFVTSLSSKFISYIVLCLLYDFGFIYRFIFIF